MMSMTRDSSNKATAKTTIAINPTTWVTPISMTDRNLSGRIIQHLLSPPPLIMKRSSTLSSSPLSRRSSSSTNCKQPSSSFNDSFNKRFTQVASNKSKDNLPAEVFFPLEFDHDEDANENNKSKNNKENANDTPFSLPTLTRRPNKKLRSLMLVINENDSDGENGDDRSQHPRRLHDARTGISITPTSFVKITKEEQREMPLCI